MNFEWDEAKGDTCAKVRRFNFAYATRVFYAPDRIIEADARHSYGEERYQVMGKIDGRLYVVVYTPRHDAIRIVSARKANQREVKHYENCTNED